jgi:hypothetical protein
MVVDFRGAPPHDLGTAEIATARLADGSIEVIVHLLDDWHRPIAQIVQFKMVPSLARLLADSLTIAASEAAATR